MGVDIQVTLRQPSAPPTRLAVATGMSRAISSVLTLSTSTGLPTPSSYTLTDGGFTSTSVAALGSSFISGRFYIRSEDLPLAFAGQPQILIWSSADNWVVFNVGSSFTSLTRRLIRVTVAASSGAVSARVAVYFGDASLWPVIDDGTLAAVPPLAVIPITGVNITTPTLNPGTALFTLTANIIPADANVGLPVTYRWTTLSGVFLATNNPLTLQLPGGGQIIDRVTITDTLGNTFTDTITIN